VSQTVARIPTLIAPRQAGSSFRLSVALQAALLLLVVANLGRIPVFTTGGGDRSVPVLFNDMVVGGFILFAAIGAILNQRLELDAVALCGIAFAALGGLSAVAGISRFGLSATEELVAFAFLARWLCYFALYIVAINSLAARDVLPVWRAMETAVLLFAAFGILQAAFLPDFALMVYPDARATVDWDAQQHRLVSTLLDPNYAGALIMMVLLVQVSMLASGARVAGWKLLLLLAALLLTLSRSSILGFGLGLGVIFLARGLSKRLLAMLMGVAIVVAAALPKLLQFAKQYQKLSVDASALGRLVSWAHEWTVFTEHPIVGIGFNTWGAVQQRHGWEAVAAASFGIEGGLLFIAVLTGVVGLLLYLLMAIVVWRRSRSIWRDASRLPYERGIAIALPAITIAMFAHSMFSNSLLHPLLMEPMWILWALGFVIASDRMQAPTADA
jgi:O-antigen ligase